MKQFKALIKKEWVTNKKIFLIPIWMILGSYGAVLLGIFTEYIKTGHFSIIQTDFNYHNMPSADLLMWTVNLLLAFGPAFLIFILSAVTSDNMLNDDFKRKCAIFHLSQPVNLWKLLLSKISANVVFFSIILLIINIFNFFVVSSFMAVLIKGNMLYGFVGFIQSFILAVSNIFYFAALQWFFSSIFSEKSGIKTFGILAGYEFVRVILMNISIIKLPSIVNFIFSLAFNNVKVMMFSMDMNKNIWKALPANQQLTLLIQETWLGIMNWQMLLKIAISIALFAGSYYFYKHRDVA